MSLSIYLYVKGINLPVSSTVPVRKDGKIVDIPLKEWQEANPNREPVMVVGSATSDQGFYDNITGNLAKMANEAGLYDVLWGSNGSKAKSLIPKLKEGLKLLIAKPDEFKALNPANGWGTYTGLVTSVKNYLAVCIKYPEAIVSSHS